MSAQRSGSSRRSGTGQMPPMMMMPQMMMPQMMGMGGQQQAGGKNDDVESDDGSDMERQREELRADKRPLSTSYRMLGARKGGLIKSHKLDIIEHVSGNGVSGARCVRLDELDLDKIIFVLTELPPHTRMNDLRCKSKFDLKATLQKEVARIGNRSGEFSSTLTSENISALAMTYGWESLWDYEPLSKAPGRRSLPGPNQPKAAPPMAAPLPSAPVLQPDQSFIQIQLPDGSTQWVQLPGHQQQPNLHGRIRPSNQTLMPALANGLGASGAPYADPQQASMNQLVATQQPSFTSQQNQPTTFAVPQQPVHGASTIVHQVPNQVIGAPLHPGVVQQNPPINVAQQNAPAIPNPVQNVPAHVQSPQNQNGQNQEDGHQNNLQNQDVQGQQDLGGQNGQQTQNVQGQQVEENLCTFCMSALGEVHQGTNNSLHCVLLGLACWLEVACICMR